MAHPPPSTSTKSLVITLLLKIVMFAVLLALLVILVTDTATVPLTFFVDWTVHFDDTYAYRCVLASIIIGLVYSFWQVAVSLYQVAAGNRLIAGDGSAREAALSKWKARYEQRLDKALSEHVEALLENPDKDTWASIRQLFTTETEIATSKMSARISCFEIENEKSSSMIRDLRDYARNVVERKAREKAQIVLQTMTNRFAATLNYAAENKKSTKKSIRNARAESLRILSVMAVVRLDEKPDKIENMLFSTILKKKSSSKSLTSSTWPEVSPEDTLITPAQCNSLWEQFEEKIFGPTQTFIQRKGERKGRFITAAQTALAAASVAVAVAAIIIAY